MEQPLGRGSVGTWLASGAIFVVNALVFAVGDGPTILVVLSAFTGLAALATALAGAAGAGSASPG